MNTQSGIRLSRPAPLVALTMASCLVAASLMAFGQAAGATARRWTVDATAPPGCSASVCQTVGSALQAASTGDTIELRDGRYANTTISKSGVTIRPASGASPVLTGATRIYASDVTLSDLDVEGALFVESSASRVTIERIAGRGIFFKIRGANHVTLRDSVIIGREDVDAVQITDGARSVLIQRNEIWGATISDAALALPSAQRPHVDCVQMFGGGNAITFRRNYIGNCDMSAFMIKSDGAALTNVLLERNFIQDCRPVTPNCDGYFAVQVHAGTDDWRVESTDPAAYYPLEGLVFRQNTIDGGVLFGNPYIGRVQFVGNVVTAGGRSVVSLSGYCTRHVFDHNVLGARVSCAGFPSGGNAFLPVSYVGRAGRDLHLAPGSGGREFASPHATALDFDGEPVCGLADAGADETCPPDTAPSSTTSTTPTTTSSTTTPSTTTSSTTTTPTTTPTGAQRVIVVIAGNDTPPSGDRPLLALLERPDVQVRIVDDDKLVSADLDDAALVVITSSVVPAKVPTWLGRVSKPMLVSEAYSFTRLGLTQDNAEVAGQTDLVVSMASHPIAAHLYGSTVRVASVGTSFGYGAPAAAATVIAELKTGRAAIFAYKKGDRLANGTMANAPRVGFYLGYESPGKMNSAGAQTFAAAVDWLLR